MGKGIFSIIVFGKLNEHIQKNGIGPCLTQLMKINWKCIKDFNKKLATVKHLEYNIWKNLLYISLGNNIFDMTQKQ